MVWSGDARAFWYVAVDENHRPPTVMLHRLGTPQSDDETVYEESDSGFFVGIGETQSGAYLVVTANDHETSEVHLAERATPFAPLRVVAKREPKLIYSVEHRGDELFVLTNADGAEDFKIAVAPLDDPARSNWRDLIPHRAGVMIRFQHVLARHLVRLELRMPGPA